METNKIYNENCLDTMRIMPDKNNGHPAVFPEYIVNDHILSWSSEGDLVYDPFAGSGTTAKMSKLNNRE